VSCLNTVQSVNNDLGEPGGLGQTSPGRDREVYRLSLENVFCLGLEEQNEQTRTSMTVEYLPTTCPSGFWNMGRWGHHHSNAFDGAGSKVVLPLSAPPLLLAF